MGSLVGAPHAEPAPGDPEINGLRVARATPTWIDLYRGAGMNDDGRGMASPLRAIGTR